MDFEQKIKFYYYTADYEEGTERNVNFVVDAEKTPMWDDILVEFFYFLKASGYEFSAEPEDMAYAAREANINAMPEKMQALARSVRDLQENEKSNY